MRTLQGGLRGATVESQADKMRKVMEREVEVGKKAFDAAVEKMSIAIHPALYRLYEDYCEVEGLPPHLVDSVGSGPDLTAFLQDDSYRLAVPPYYRPLLEIDTSRTRT